MDALDLIALERHLRETGVPVCGPLSAELIAGGRSNLTFLVSDTESKWVLRRPPLHGRTPSAHDMAREYRVVAALACTSVPVARAVAMSDDDTAIGTTFQMVDYVPGRVVRDARDLGGFADSAAIERCVDALVAALVDLHAVDPMAVGLGSFGAPAGYLERQLKRWGSQWELFNGAGHGDDSDIGRLRSRLVARLPRESRSSIVHGDYRIDNTILDEHDPTIVKAVVDWELSTLGDPLADIALACAYRHPALDDVLDVTAAWSSPRLPSAAEIAERYATRSGTSLSHWNFHMGLAYFKIAVIAAGIDYRSRQSTGTGAATPNRAGAAVGPFIASALAAIR